VRAWWLALVCVIGLVGPPGAGANVPERDPDLVGFSVDVATVDLKQCEALARRLRTLAFLKLAGTYQDGRRTLFRVEGRRGARAEIVSCVQRAFDRQAAYSDERVLPPRKVTRYHLFSVGELSHGLPPWPRVRELLRERAGAIGGRRVLGPGISTGGGRCLLTTTADDVVDVFFDWVEANFPEKLPPDASLDSFERYRVDAGWVFDVRRGVEAAYVACLVPEGPIEHRVMQVRDQLYFWHLFEKDLERRTLFVRWTLDQGLRPAQIESCVGQSGGGGERAAPAAVEKLRTELSNLLAQQPMPAGTPGERYSAALGPWHGLSLRRLIGDGRGLPHRCAP
jgi:hypothetical protein